MADVTLDPSADAKNEGWSLEGTLGTLWEAFSNLLDSDYAKSPANKGRATVSFPLDINTIPEGAVITSVSIFVRARKSSSSNISFTVNLVPSDDTSKFTSRTLFPTTSFADYEVGTYTADPLGNPWDVERLNKLMVQVFSYSSTANGVHISRVYATATYSVRPNITVTDPTGNLVTASPTLAWTYSQSDGDIQALAEYKIFQANDVANAGFDPNINVPVYSNTVTGDLTSFILPTALPSGSYYAYVRVYSAYGAVSQWGSKSFAVAAPYPGAPNITATGSGSDSKVILALQDTSNLLSTVQADAEVSADQDEYTITNGTFARTSTDHYGDGTAAYSMTSSGTSNMYIESDYVRLAPSMPITIRAQGKAATSGRTNVLTLTYYDADFATTGTALTVSSTDATTDWTEILTSGTTPAGTVYGKLKYQITAPGAASEVHYVDHLGVMYGTDSPWTHGGHRSRNLLDSDLGGSPNDGNWTAASGTTLSTITNESRTGASGERAMRMTRGTPSTSIAFRATGTQFSATSSTTSVTLNKPAGVVSADVMIAIITTNGMGNCTPPTGWTLIDKAQVDDGTTDLSMFILARTAGGSEPASWTATLSNAADRVNARVVAYSGCSAVGTSLALEGVTTQTTDTADLLQSATLNNTYSNSWRVSAFAARDDVSGTMSAAETGPGGLISGISFVGSSAYWGSTTDGTGFTIYKPQGTQQDDIMIATCSWWDDEQTPASFTPPSGWTVVDTRISYTGVNGFFVWDYQCATVVMWRKAGASEPSSWSASLNGGRNIRISGAVAYRNVDGTTPFIAENSAGLTSSSHTVSTATVNNTNSKAWSVCLFSAHGYSDISNGNNWTSDESVKRLEGVSVDNGFVPDGHTIAFFDSNGIINTGNRQRTATIPGTHTVDGATGWIGILNPSSGSYVPGPAQTERSDDSVGGANPRIITGLYDSNGVISSGNSSVVGTYAPSSGNSLHCMASWSGILVPATPTADGVVMATMTDTVDISKIPADVLNMADNKITVGAAFIGNTPGSPYMKLYFYRANQLLSSLVAEGDGYGTSIWNYTARSFDLPSGTTRVKAEVYSTNRADSDTVDVDRVTIALGNNTSVWRNGTKLNSHPVWGVPVIEYQDDDGTGFGDWSPLAGTSFHPPVYDYLTGQVTYEDHTVVPLVTRQYRVKTYTYGLLGDAFTSVYSQASNSVQITASNWWLKDIEDPTNNIILPVMAEQIKAETTNTATAYQPLGETYPLLVSEGFKTDTIELPLIAQKTDWVTFRKLIKSGKSLFLQTDVDDAWWVRPLSNISAETLVSANRQTDPYRVVKVQFIQVAPEA